MFSQKVSILKSSAKMEFPLLLVGSSLKEVIQKLKELKIDLFDWQLEELAENELFFYQVKQGLLGVLILNKANAESEIPGFFSANSKQIARDTMGKWHQKVLGESYSLMILDSLEAGVAQGFGAGASIANYNYKKGSHLKVKLFGSHKADFEKGVTLGDSVNHSRWLVDAPANKVYPESFKKMIVNHFSKSSKFEVKILNKSQLSKAGYGLISAVGQGAETGPYLVHLSYKGKAKSAPIAFVGKGITFDTGGLDIKPSKFMRWMKKDMGGAAALFGVAHWVRETKPQQNFDFIFALAENAVSKEAFRPGDVVSTKNGLDIEIHNTDAEGRLALGSGLNYLSQLKKKYKYCVDVATLTGAIKVGLGEKVAGLFSNDFAFGQEMMNAGEKSGEPVWLMPLPHWTRKALNSSVADYTNCGDGYGGAVVAAEFLRLFVPKKTPWCHLDIYAWTDSKKGAYLSKGATGQGVQVICEWLKGL